MFKTDCSFGTELRTRLPKLLRLQVGYIHVTKRELWIEQSRNCSVEMAGSRKRRARAQ
jgi:hypothetical protein